MVVLVVVVVVAIVVVVVAVVVGRRVLGSKVFDCSHVEVYAMIVRLNEII